MLRRMVEERQSAVGNRQSIAAAKSWLPRGMLRAAFRIRLPTADCQLPEIK